MRTTLTAGLFALALGGTVALATPAAAELRCTTDGDIAVCSGGDSMLDGGFAGHSTVGLSTLDMTFSGGVGVPGVGGIGQHCSGNFFTGVTCVGSNLRP